MSEKIRDFQVQVSVFKKRIQMIEGPLSSSFFSEFKLCQLIEQSAAKKINLEIKRPRKNYYN